MQWSAAAGGNDHWYDIVSTNLTWQGAVLAAGSLTHDGQAGHVATITSAAEQSFITSAFGNLTSYFLGGSDSQQEGVWRWMTGPEAGQIFYVKGQSVQPGFSFFEPQFAEPNGFALENFLEIKSFGNNTWNDTAAMASGYVVEFNARPSSEVSVPEPSTLLLFGAGLLGFGVVSRDRGASYVTAPRRRMRA